MVSTYHRYHESSAGACFMDFKGPPGTPAKTHRRVFLYYTSKESNHGCISILYIIKKIKIKIITTIIIIIIIITIIIIYNNNNNKKQ